MTSRTKRGHKLASYTLTLAVIGAWVWVAWKAIALGNHIAERLHGIGY